MAKNGKKYEQQLGQIHSANLEQLQRIIKKYERKALKGREPEKTLYDLARSVLGVKNSEHTRNAHW